MPRKAGDKEDVELYIAQRYIENPVRPAAASPLPASLAFFSSAEGCVGGCM